MSAVSGASSAGEREIADALWAILGMQSEDGKGWLVRTLESLGTPPDPTRLRIAFSRAGRELGERPIELSPAAQPHVQKLDVGDFAASWSTCDLGRALLLLETLRSVEPDEQVGCVEHLFRTGELGEQESVMRMLPFLPCAERFAALAAEAARTNATRVFEALACDNAYPARHMPDPSFNQMVIKAIFSEVPILRIRALRMRTTPELVRMARDYANERRAAGRTVPSDIAMLESWQKERA